MSAITTATIVGITAAGASAGASIYAAKKGANAAKDAAATQSASADKALELQRQSYATQRQDFSPYQQAGQGALARLQQQSAQPRQTFDPSQLQGQPRMPMTASLGNPTGQPPPGAAMPPGMPQAGQPPMAPQGPPPQAGGALWTVQAPDGSTKQLPPQIAQQFMARGAKRIG